MRAFRVRSPFGRSPFEYAGWREIGALGLWALALAAWSLACAVAGGLL